MQKMRILLVGMDSNYLARMQNALSLAGLENTQLFDALTGAMALELCSEEYPEAVLSDYDLPDMSGLDLLEKLGEYKSKTHMKFMLFAYPADLDQERVQQAARLGLDDLVLKPFEDQELAVRLGLRLHPGEDFFIELECRPRRGEKRCTRILGRKPALDQENLVTGIFQDVNRQKHAENSLMEPSEQRSLHSAALEQSGEGIVITNQKFGVLYVNPFFDQISGFKASEMIHRLKGRMPDNNFCELLLEEKADKGVFWREELSLMDNNGDIRQVEVKVYALKDSKNGLAASYLLLVRDITEKLNLEKQLQQSRKLEALRAVAKKVAHDFNNSLMGIQGFTELALSRLQDGDHARQYLQSTLQTVQRTRDIVQQILTFSGHKEISPSFLDAAEVLREALNLLQATMPDNIELKTEIRSGLPPVSADFKRLLQLISNLCINAVQAMPQGGRLRVGLYSTSLNWKHREDMEGPAEVNHLVLEVEDTGEGMDEQIVGRIFDPFFTTKVRNERTGLGLGLSVVYSIMQDLGGSIRVKSDPGKGALFKVFLPTAERSSAPAGISAKLDNDAGNEKARILFVDDQQDIVTWGVQALKDLGYRVQGTSNSKQALALFQENPDSFDLLVTDLRMQGLSGADLIHKVKQIRPGLRIILCTGQLDKIVSGLDKKADAVLYKPFSISDLSVLVDTLARENVIG